MAEAHDKETYKISNYLICNKHYNKLYTKSEEFMNKRLTMDSSGKAVIHLNYMKSDLVFGSLWKDIFSYMILKE